MKVLRLILCALAALALGTLALGAHARAATLYGSTAGGGQGRLYILDPATGGVVQDIGPLNDVTGLNYGLTGLAFDPFSGVLYGSVGNSYERPARLVTVDPTTATVTDVGSFNAGNPGTREATMADLAFNPTTGGLFGVGSVGGPQLYSINPATGQATIVGGTGLTSTTGGGLAIDTSGAIYGTPTAGRFGTYDLTTGAFTNIANPTKFVGGGYAALAFNDTGALYGLNLGTANATHLVTINPATGAVTDLGASVTNLDAIAFRPGGGAIPEPGTLALLLGPGAMGLMKLRRRK